MTTLPRGRDPIAVLVGSELVLRSVERGAHGRGVIRCMTDAQLESCIRTRILAGIVYEAAFDGRGPHRDVGRILSGARCPVLVAMTGSSPVVADVVALLDHPHEHISFAGHGPGVFDDIRRSVARILGHGVEPSAVLPIVTAFLPLIPKYLWEPGVSAAALSQTDTNVEALFRACGGSSSAGRLLFQRADVAAPHVWLGCFRSAHGAWWRFELGLNAADAARRGGFPDASGLAHCVLLYTGHSLMSWKGLGGFDAVRPRLHSSTAVNTPPGVDSHSRDRRDSCAYCSSVILENGAHSKAIYVMSGEACDEYDDSCANCIPSCSAVDSIVGDWASVSAWYAWNDCSSNGCGTQEPGRDLPAVLELPIAVRAAALDEVLSRSDGTIKFNEARSAIQVYGCQGRVVRQFDLDEGVAQDLRALIAAVKPR